MTEVAKRIEKLRALMAEQNIDAYVVPTADFHQSEYVGEHFKARKFITGFSGSYGTAVIAKDDAGLWTDGRYFTQALTEMEGSGVRLMIHLLQQNGLPRRSRKAVRSHLMVVSFLWVKDRNMKKYWAQRISRSNMK